MVIGDAWVIHSEASGDRGDGHGGGSSSGS